jgi:hypothetical protein
MPGVAQFHTITETDQAKTLVVGDSSDGYRFDLPDLDRTHPVVVMFKVSGTTNAVLIMTNEGGVTPTVPENFIHFELDSTFTKPRSWHEIVPGNRFAPSSNKFSVELASSELGAKVVYSDIVLLYYTNPA